MITQSDLERERYEARLKMQRDISSALAYASDKNRAEGREQGRKEELTRHIHFCQRLLRRTETPAEQLLALSLEDLDRLAQQLEAEVTRPPGAPSATWSAGD